MHQTNFIFIQTTESTIYELAPVIWIDFLQPIPCISYPGTKKVHPDNNDVLDIHDVSCSTCDYEISNTSIWKHIIYIYVRSHVHTHTFILCTWTFSK